MTPRLSEIGNALLPIGSPVGWPKLLALSQWMGLGPTSKVLDLGAGRGEVLLRLAKTYGCGGTTALERRAAFSALTATAIAEAGLAGLAGLEAVCADAGPWLQSMPPDSFDAILCLGSSGALSGYRACLEQLGHWLKPGGCLLIGEGYWQREPDPDYLVASGIPRNEMGSHADNVSQARALGWEYLLACTASPDEWDDFEGRYHLSVRNFLQANPHDPDAAALDAAITRWHDAYLRHGRETLGFGVYLLRKATEAK
ncbi:MAG: SAM-dependent methyltransferase [Candidatus Melainabacteria bacterium HGW-Melainabacteria-1]|nr:MAG: SAM-dependent methyltransferase [Candidatus Melainabacteria bacterium HGW-Melainabacteria-1]